MHFSSLIPIALGLFAQVSPAFASTHSNDDLIVKTNLFTVQGIVSPNSTNVRIFKGIPYAEPPTGTNRFRPPVTKKPTNQLINATAYAPICVQYNNGGKTVYNQYITGDLPYPGAVQSEDCLYVNIWTPRAAKIPSKGLAVMIWVHGGGFTSGAAANPYKEGTSFAANQNVIVVSMDYRVNIFGFPNAPALDGINLNPGMLDIRKSVEWTYANIKYFGGNPENMILFGQSAGSAAVDAYSYAYATDPLVNGFISQSGVSGLASGVDPTGSNFTYVAQQLNCTGSKDAVFSCLQNVPSADIIQIYNKYNATLNGGASLSFGPKVDNQSVFANYTDRRTRGLYAQKAYLTGNTENEFSSLITYVESGPNQTVVNTLTNAQFTCPTMLSTGQRAARKTPQWRYWYRGIYPNQNPLPWLGAYHSSEIPMVFGTTSLGLGPDTPAERAMSEHMQGAWAAFAKDPQRGLIEYGWPLYEPGKDTLIVLAEGNSTKALFKSRTLADAAC